MKIKPNRSRTHKVKKNHPWKQNGTEFFKSRTEPIHAYQAEGITKRLIKKMGKDNRGGRTTECGMGKSNYTKKGNK